MKRRYLDILRTDKKGVLEYNYVRTCDNDKEECEDTLPISELQYGVNVSVVEAVNVIHQFCPDAEETRTAIDALMQTGECHMVIWYL